MDKCVKNTWSWKIIILFNNWSSWSPVCAGKDHAISIWRRQGILQVFSFYCILQPPSHMHCVCSNNYGTSYASHRGYT